MSQIDQRQRPRWSPRFPGKTVLTVCGAHRALVARRSAYATESWSRDSPTIDYSLLLGHTGELSRLSGCIFMLRSPTIVSALSPRQGSPRG